MKWGSDGDLGDDVSLSCYANLTLRERERGRKVGLYDGDRGKAEGMSWLLQRGLGRGGLHL